MTDIDFHFNAADKLSHGCRLVRKAFASGACVVVTGETSLLDDMDLALWRAYATEFVAHCRDDAAPGVLSRSPVVLTGSARRALPHQQVLVNLGATVPEGFERFERLIDIVTDDERDRQAGRARWRHYAERGYTMRRHDLRDGA
ncbi:MAG: polymerase chi subunit HolC [Variovorax sp.]|nr:polymerase chi subunit HolC [Variovorax sp.]